MTRVVERRTHRLSLEPGVMSEAADWMDRQRALWGACSTGPPHLLRQQPRRRGDGGTWSYLDMTALGRQEEWEDIAYGGGGYYTEIDPPTRLAFTWTWDGNGMRQVIELDFEEPDDATTVRFTHSGLWDEEAVRSHEEGWGSAFDNLERTLDQRATSPNGG